MKKPILLNYSDPKVRESFFAMLDKREKIGIKVKKAWEEGKYEDRRVK